MAHHIRRLGRLKWRFFAVAVVVAVFLLFFDVALAADGIGVTLTMRAWVSTPLPPIENPFVGHTIGGNPGGMARMLQTLPFVFMGIVFLMVVRLAGPGVAGIISAGILAIVGASGVSIIVGRIMGN